MNALIIDEPWIRLILAGEKTWEMRSRATGYRGPMGLIRKGSGQIVGYAELTGTGAALTVEQMVETYDRHRIPESMVQSGAVAKWVTPWHLGNVRRLAKPVAYRHPPGAVTWVVLDANVAASVMAVASAAPLLAPSAASSHQPFSPATGFETSTQVGAGPSPESTKSREPADAFEGGPTFTRIALTDGNIRNGHLYLASARALLPSDAIGGSSAANVGARTITIECPPGQVVETDIAGDKMIFRARGFLRAFFAGTTAVAGDQVRLERLAPYHFRLALERATPQ